MFWLAFAVGLCVFMALLSALRAGQCSQKKERAVTSSERLTWYLTETHAMTAVAFWLALGAMILAVGLAKGWVG